MTRTPRSSARRPRTPRPNRCRTRQRAANCRGTRRAACRTSAREPEHGRDEQELAELDSDIEEQERERHGLLGHADLAQRTGEAEPVQQTERERDDPREPRRQVRRRGVGAVANSAPPCELRGEKKDAERDDRFDGRRRNMDETQGRRAERDAVRDREGRNGRHEAAYAVHEQQQCEHEQQMIDAEQDVLDAEHEIRAHDVERARLFGDDGRRRSGCQPLSRRAAVQIVDAQQHVGLRLRQAVHRERLAGKPGRALERGVLQTHVVENIGPYGLRQRAAGRHLRLEHGRQAARDRHLPLHRKHIGLGLGEAEECGAQAVRERGQRAQCHGEQRGAAPRAHHGAGSGAAGASSGCSMTTS